MFFLASSSFLLFNTPPSPAGPPWLPCLRSPQKRPGNKKVNIFRFRSLCGTQLVGNNYMLLFPILPVNTLLVRNSFLNPRLCSSRWLIDPSGSGLLTCLVLNPSLATLTWTTWPVLSPLQVAPPTGPARDLARRAGPPLPSTRHSTVAPVTAGAVELNKSVRFEKECTGE